MADDLPAALRDDSQAAVAFVTTEHFNLASARAATISETDGRASLFLGPVSASTNRLRRSSFDAAPGRARGSAGVPDADPV